MSLNKNAKFCSMIKWLEIPVIYLHKSFDKINKFKEHNTLHPILTDNTSLLQVPWGSAFTQF
jgi:hypothetical protein